MEECWDHEAEARLTAQCVEERAKWCLKVSTDLHQAANVSLTKESTTEEDSKLQHRTNEQVQVDIGGENHQHTEECNGPAELSIERVQPQTSHGITEQKPSGLNGLKSVKPTFYPQDSSCSPPPYSAQPLASPKSWKNS